MKIGVYCSSKEGLDRAYYEAGEAFGRTLAGRGHTLVYGGYNKGVMVAAARGASSEKGAVVGIVPKIFDKPGFTYEGCTRIFRTETMNARKAALEAESDAFAILPGGLGTFDEFFEIYVLTTLGVSKKPIGLLNINGCYDALKVMLERNVSDGFMTRPQLELIAFFEDPEALLNYLEAGFKGV